MPPHRNYATMAKTESAEKNKKRPSPDNIVDLTLDDDDDDGDDAYSSDMRRAITASLNSVRKRIRSTPGTLRKTKVKTEGSTTRNVAFLKDDGEIEVLEGDAVRQHQQQIHLSSPAAAAASTQYKDDDTVAVVGTRNHVRLPHARMHCTEKTFNNDLGYSLAARRAVNCVACEDCYCYVCDVPHQQCQGNWAEDHCLATDQGPRKEYWAQQRRARVQLKQQGGAMTVSTATTAAAGGATPGQRHLRHECPRFTAFQKEQGDGYDSDDSYYHFFGGGGGRGDYVEMANKINKFHCPNCYCYICDAPASQCTLWNPSHSYYQSQHCNAYPGPEWDLARRRELIRIYGNGPFAPDHEVIQKDTSLTKCARNCGWYSRKGNSMFNSKEPEDIDLCGACGRIADDKDLGKEQSFPYKPSVDNPTQDLLLGIKEISFRLRTRDPRKISRYAAKWRENGGQPGWNYDEAANQEEIFLHRFGSRPTLSRIISSLVRDDDKDGPKNTSIAASPSGFEKEIVVLENPVDKVLLQALQTLSESFGRKPSPYYNPPSAVNGEIEATWDSAARKGVFGLRVYAKNDGRRVDAATSMARFLGCFYGVLPFKLPDIYINLKATPNESMATSSTNKKKGHEKLAIQLFNHGVDEARQKLSLESGTGSQLLGGISAAPNAASLSFAGTLKRYFQEILPECVNYRYFSARGYSIDSFLSPDDHTLAQQTRNDAVHLGRQTSSLKGLLNHVENRGHAAAPFVEGLTVELLPFQSQSLQWAIERETTPGGIQSFFWTKLPPVVSPQPQQPNNNADIYYNPILGKLSTTKPALVRGGIIAEQMGLGKTVISLALILRNPAPLAPPTGSHVSTITAQPNPGTSFWDPDLYQRTSETKPKRGSIISRGTLVVCNVSLVGQWIAEAKSKLDDPGVVYSYHGGSRKRDPQILAQNSIVVTTYETLASDAVFHAKKNADSDYCPPCEQVRWFRIICDESHVIRNANNGKSKAVMALVADNKWLVSGTPINTTVMDLKNQLLFLGIENASAMMEVFKTSIFNRIHDPSRNNLPGLGMFSFLARSIMMRHSQAQKYTGTNTTLMSLPPKTERVVTVKFSKEEKLEYARLENSARDFYVRFKEQHGRIGSNYLKLTQKLTPLRVACAGGQVPLEDTSVAEKEEDDGSGELGENGEDDGSGEEKPKKKPKKVQVFSDFAFVSKLQTLIKELKDVRTKDKTAKCLVFSQYASTLKWLQTELPKHGFQFRTLSGDMTMTKRAKALRDFQNDPPTTVFLLSMRAGAVGINLTQANQIFLMEPCFNPALEAQAIGRVHRLGQKRAVTITHLVMKDSVESRIRKMLEKKYGSASATAVLDDVEGEDGDDDDKKPAAKPAAAKPAALGSIATDKATVMADEFDLLFGVETTASTAASAEPMPDTQTSGGGGGDKASAWL